MPMKKLYKNVFFTILLTFSVLAVKAQVIEDVVNNIRAGNVPGVAKYFDNSVTITINGTQSIYSKTQAEMVLKDFFIRNQVKDFDVKQSGTAGTTSRFAIGNLATSNGTYQLYVVMKQKDVNFMLQEIRFEK